jgi:hypothetical protein
VERLIPYSEAKVYRTKNGFVVRDNNDDQWCKFVPFDDLDRVATKVACRTLEPARIEAMELMPLPSFVPVPKEALQEYETELEHSSIQDREVAKQAPTTVHIESLRMTEEPTFEDELTSEDLIRNQFGSLAPYIEDYFNDQYDIEEEIDAHLPSLIGQNQTETTYLSISDKSPLSYQRTVFDENPLLSENFEERRVKTESLICSASSDIESDGEDIPSSLIPSLYEHKLNDASKNKRRGSKHVAKLALVEENEEVEETELTDWQLFRRSMPENFIINFLITMLTLFIIVLGTVVEVHMLLTAGAFAILGHFGKITIDGLRKLFKDFMGKFVKKQYRKNFTNKEGPTCFHPNPLNPPIKGLSAPKFTPFGNLKLLSPEGMVKGNKKIKRTYQIEPAKISEARVVKMNDERPYIITKFAGNLTRYALLDTGATCNTISPTFLEEIQKHSYVPSEQKKVDIEGCVPGVRSQGKMVAYLDFQLETGYTLKNVPFLVYKGNHDILLGSNIIRSQRWSNCWKNDLAYIDVGYSEPLVPIHYGDDASIETVAVSIAEIVIHPSETLEIDLEIPQLNSRAYSPFKRQNLEVTSLFDDYEKGGFKIIPTISKARKGCIKTLIRNEAEMPLQIIEGMEIAKVTSLPKDTKIETFEELEHVRKNYYSLPHIMTEECHCQQELKAGENETIVQILVSDNAGNTAIGSVLNPGKPQYIKPGIHILKLDPKQKGKNKKKQANILLVTDEDGGLGHITETDMLSAKEKLQKILKVYNLKPLFFFMNPLTSISLSTRMVITELWQYFPYSFYPVFPVLGHEKCTRPSVYMNVPELLTGISSTHIHIQNGPAPPSTEFLTKEKNSPVKIVRFKEAVLTMFKNFNKLHCHFHIPVYGRKGQSLTEETRNFYI